jgi:2-C-methyl-D-erythritol 4-phosphate cytidylyltransferase
MEEESVAVVICAAGSSSRMGGVKKEYQALAKTSEQRAKNKTNAESHTSITVLGSAVCAFASVSSINTIVIAIPENGETAAREALPKELLKNNKPRILFAVGGKTRSASVFNALSLLEGCNSRYVLIHDGARPWVSSTLINNIISAVKKNGAVIPLLPLTETPKEGPAPLGEFQEQTVFVKSHLKRANTGIAQTPQGFKFPEIFAAHKKAAATGEEFTDDAEIWGRFFGPVVVIPGEPENRKITFHGDL